MTDDIRQICNLIAAMCGNPDPAEACRLIAELCKEKIDERDTVKCSVTTEKST